MQRDHRRRPTRFTHNRELPENEPDWGNIDKATLPRTAFACQGEPDKKTARDDPQSRVQDGTGKDNNGIYTDCGMCLHREGLNAECAEAQLPKSEQESSPETKGPLQAHRKALKPEKKPTGKDKARKGGKDGVFFLFDAGVTAEEIVAAIKQHLEP